MIDLHILWHRFCLSLMVVFFVLWLLSEWQHSKALSVATTSTSVAQQCVARFRESVDNIGDALRGIRE